MEAGGGGEWGELDDRKTEISGKIVFGIGAKGIFLQLLLVFFFANLTLC